MGWSQIIGKCSSAETTQPKANGDDKSGREKAEAFQIGKDLIDGIGSGGTVGKLIKSVGISPALRTLKTAQARDMSSKDAKAYPMTASRNGIEHAEGSILENHYPPG